MTKGLRLVAVAALAAIGLLTAAVAQASEPLVYFKLAPFQLEMWDKDGFFHTITIELTGTFPVQPQINKTVTLKIRQVLETLPYEELLKNESPAIIKSVALDMIRSQPGGENVEEVLLTRYLFR